MSLLGKITTRILLKMKHSSNSYFFNSVTSRRLIGDEHLSSTVTLFLKMVKYCQTDVNCSFGDVNLESNMSAGKTIKVCLYYITTTTKKKSRYKINYVIRYLL